MLLLEHESEAAEARGVGEQTCGPGWVVVGEGRCVGEKAAGRDEGIVMFSEPLKTNVLFKISREGVEREENKDLIK